MKIQVSIKVVLVITALFCFSAGGHAGDSDGRVCVQTIPSSLRSSWKGNHTGATEQSVFRLRIDDLPAINITTNSSGVFTNLSLIKKHLVSIRLDDKLLTSFRFSFEDRPSHLRLWYNPFYGTWSLSDVRAGERCACSRVVSADR
jgi:hypothetical protein